MYQDRMRRILRNVCYRRRDRWMWLLPRSSSSSTPLPVGPWLPVQSTTTGAVPYIRFRNYWIPLKWNAESNVRNNCLLRVYAPWWNDLGLGMPDRDGLG